MTRRPCRSRPLPGREVLPDRVPSITGSDCR
jgi:hypothetical protein